MYPANASTDESENKSVNESACNHRCKCIWQKYLQMHLQMVSCKHVSLNNLQMHPTNACETRSANASATEAANASHECICKRILQTHPANILQIHLQMYVQLVSCKHVLQMHLQMHLQMNTRQEIHMHLQARLQMHPMNVSANASTDGVLQTCLTNSSANTFCKCT